MHDINYERLILGGIGILFGLVQLAWPLLFQRPAPWMGRDPKRSMRSVALSSLFWMVAGASIVLDTLGYWPRSFYALVGIVGLGVLVLWSQVRDQGRPA